MSLNDVTLSNLSTYLTFVKEDVTVLWMPKPILTHDGRKDSAYYWTDLKSSDF